MLEILARSFLIATRGDLREDRENLIRQRRWEDAYFWQGRRGSGGRADPVAAVCRASHRGDT